MANIQLSCNIRSCHKKLSNQACVTSCSHIFCAEHGQSMTGNGNGTKCLACGTHLSDDLGFAQTNLNPSEQYKAMILAGLNPDQIMEIATRAISFFVYQLNTENKNKENMLRHRKGQMEELKHFCQTLTSKYKADLQKLRRTIENLKQELDEKVKETETQLQRITQCQRENQKLQTQLEFHKRELVNMNIFPKKENIRFMTPNSHGSRNSYCKSTFSDPLNKQNFCFGNIGEFALPLHSNGRYSH